MAKGRKSKFDQEAIALYIFKHREFKCDSDLKSISKTSEIVKDVALNFLDSESNSSLKHVQRYLNRNTGNVLGLIKNLVEQEKMKEKKPQLKRKIDRDSPSKNLLKSNKEINFASIICAAVDLCYCTNTLRNASYKTSKFYSEICSLLLLKPTIKNKKKLHRNVLHILDIHNDLFTFNFNLKQQLLLNDNEELTLGNKDPAKSFHTCSHCDTLNSFDISNESLLLTAKIPKTNEMHEVKEDGCNTTSITDLPTLDSNEKTKNWLHGNHNIENFSDKEEKSSSVSSVQILRKKQRIIASASSKKSLSCNEFDNCAERNSDHSNDKLSLRPGELLSLIAELRTSVDVNKIKCCLKLLENNCNKSLTESALINILNIKLDLCKANTQHARVNLNSALINSELKMLKYFVAIEEASQQSLITCYFGEAEMESRQEALLRHKIRMETFYTEEEFENLLNNETASPKNNSSDQNCSKKIKKLDTSSCINIISSSHKSNDKESTPKNNENKKQLNLETTSCDSNSMQLIISNKEKCVESYSSNLKCSENNTGNENTSCKAMNMVLNISPEKEIVTSNHSSDSDCKKHQQILETSSCNHTNIHNNSAHEDKDSKAAIFNSKVHKRYSVTKAINVSVHEIFSPLQESNVTKSNDKPEHKNSYNSNLASDQESIVSTSNESSNLRGDDITIKNANNIGLLKLAQCNISSSHNKKYKASIDSNKDTVSNCSDESSSSLNSNRKRSENIIHSPSATSSNENENKSISSLKSKESIKNKEIKTAHSSSKELLKKSKITKKCKNVNKTDYSKCIKYFTTLKITTVEWNSIYDRNKKKLYTKRYCNAMREKMFKHQKGCVLSVKKCETTLKHAFVIKMYCSHKYCPVLFKLFIKKTPKKDENLKVKVNYNGLKRKHGDFPIANKCSGDKREKIKEMLRLDSTVNIKRAMKKNADVKGIHEGNLQDIYSDKVFHKMKSEKNSENDHAEDDMTDLMLRFREQFKNTNSKVRKRRTIPYFIKSYGEPLKVVLYSFQQVKVANSYKQSILHLDATGCVFKSPKHVKSKLLYYAGIIKTAQRLFPILEFVLSKQDSVSIGNCLREFRYYCETTAKMWPLFCRVVTDFSFGIINAVLEAFNLMDTLQYLKYCYKILTDEKFTHIHSNVFVNLCCNHLIRVFAKTIEKETKTNYECKHFVVETLTAMLEQNNLDCIRNMFIALCIILNLKVKNKFYFEAMEVICESSFKTNKKSEQSVPYKKNQLIEIDENFPSNETIYRESPFYKDFKQSFLDNMKDVDIVHENEKSEEENKIFCPQLVEIMLRRFIAYLPLWSRIMELEDEENPTARFTNAYIECFFGIRKKKESDKKREDKIGRVIDLSWECAESLYLEEILLIRKGRCTKTEYISNKNIKKAKRPVKKLCIIDKKKESSDSVKSDHSTDKKIKNTKTKKRPLKSLCIEKKSKTSESSTDEIKYKEEGWGMSRKKKIYKESCIKSKKANVGKTMRSYFAKKIISQKKKELDDHTNKMAIEEDVSDNFAVPESFVGSAISVSSTLSVPQVSSHNHVTASVPVKKNKSLPMGNNEKDNQMLRTTSSPEMNLSFYSNYLVENTEYYKDLDCNTDYYIGFYGDLCYKNFLRIRDYRRLHLHYPEPKTNIQSYLTDGLMDLYTYLVIRNAKMENNIFFGEGSPSTQAIDGHLTRDSYFYKKPILGKKYIILPYNRSKHFMLLFANVEKKEFYFFDPMNDRADEVRTFFTKFQKILKSFEIVGNIKTDYQNYTCPEIQYPRQKDKINCGVFVLYYIETLINNKKMDLTMQGNRFRTEIKNNMLKESLDVSQFCLHCGSEAFKDMTVNWTSCIICKRWYHLLEQCLHFDPESSKFDSENFKCELCLKHVCA